ncbi:MAG: glycosyltransferase family 2 protein [Betaproteobacteria bacterium]|nr:glycosyltransferase family 2 protein [Betaproteobacteria bacterium]
MPEVSVLLPVRDGARTLALAMLSVLQQSFGDFELLLLDDGSVDASPDIALRFGDPRVRLLRDGMKQGLAARLNQGIAAAAGRYIARMDADDVCFPHRFARQVARLNADSSLDLVACRALIFDDSGAATGLSPHRLSHEDLCAQPWNGFYLVHPSWMGRADWFRRYRYQTPELVRAQDQELLLRAYPDSRFAVLDEILLGYRMGPIALGKTLSARHCLLSAQISRFAQRRQWRNLLLALLATGLKLPRDLLFATAAGRRWRDRRGGKIPPEIEQAWNALLGSLYRRLDELHLLHGCEPESLQKAQAHER